MKYLLQYSTWNGRDVIQVNSVFDTEEKFLEEVIIRFKETKFKVYTVTDYEFDEKFKHQQKISNLIDQKFTLLTNICGIKNKLKFIQRNFENQKDILNEKGIEVYKNEINEYENKICEFENEIKNLNTELAIMRNEIKIEELSKNLQKYLQRDLLCCNGCLPNECGC